MTVEKIPEAFLFACDGCRVTEKKPNRSRPAHWTELHILADAYDWQGAACADASVRRLLCPVCSRAVHDAANAAIIAIRAKTRPKDPTDA